MKAFPKDITVQTMSVRHIGVENELGVIGNDEDIEHIEEACKKRGLLQSVGWDGGGREFRTNPISVRSLKQVRGFNYVMEYYGILQNTTKVLSTGGTHIHISILNSDHPNLEANATAMGVAFYKQFQKISGRKSMWARKRDFSTIQKVQWHIDYVRACTSDKKSRVYSMKGGMLAPTRHQTFEFRGPKGSNDCKEILAWVEFLENVVKVCNRKSVEGVQFRQLLKGERISAYVESLKGWRKLTDKDLDKKFNGSKLQ